MGEENTGGDTEGKFVEVEGAKFQADPENEGQPLKDESGNPIPFEEKGDEGTDEGGEEGKFVEQDGKKYVADPDDPTKPLMDDQGNPVPIEEDKGKKPEGEPGEPPVRDKKDFIIDRLRQSRDKLKDKTDEGIDDEIEVEEESRIKKIVDKHYGDRLNKIDEGENERELDQFFAKEDNAKFKTEEAKIRKWWKHPSRNHLPISTVAYEVIGESLLKVGAKKQREADEEAKKSGSGGHSSRGTMPKKDSWGESKEEFEAHQQKVREKRSE